MRNGWNCACVVKKKFFNASLFIASLFIPASFVSWKFPAITLKIFVRLERALKMYRLHRTGWKRFFNLLQRRLRSTRETIAESESASKKMKILPEELSSSCHDEFDTNSSEKRGDINVALIGGGMSTIYAAVLLKQSTLIKKVNIADSKDTLGGAVFDASHIDTSTRIKYYGKNSIDQALRNVNKKCERKSYD